MRKMAVISSDEELNARVQAICERFSNYFNPEFLRDTDDALEFITYELPEVSLINFSDSRVDPGRLVERIESDPWLHYGGVVGVHKRKDAGQAAERSKQCNVVALIPRSEFVWSFSRLLKILIQNRNILFQREMQDVFLNSITGNFVLDNDVFNVRAYANLVSNYLFNANYVNNEVRERLHVALFELLMNAIEHGNCGITYTEKTEYLNHNGDIIPLIRKKAALPENRGKQVYFSYKITPERSYYKIRDEGEGFDWRKMVEGKEINFELHGHGIRMASHYIENLTYNDKGNQVSFELPHALEAANTRPTLFEAQPEKQFKDGEVIFSEGEASNYLYYIGGGKLDIYAGGQHLSTLTPNDLFLGEMSFLLGDRRSATVVSSGESVLIPISKHHFVSVIKERPHYGIFLARLLAQRLQNLNRQVAMRKG
ncbi:MAG: cyclic nucleotide-binding domain-containing protein [Alkalispirochaetaceae bacterium]